jgi:hypothetical protein
MTIRKLMRKKLQKIKQQLRKRMHDHAPTNRWTSLMKCPC